jgi:alpha-N-arabinofuranosidase
VLPTLLNNTPLAGQDSLYASTTLDKNTNEIIIKIVNVAAVEKKVSYSIEGVKKIGSQGTVTVLTADKPDQVNSLDTPYAISPVTQALPVSGKKLDLLLEPCSFTVIRLPLK